MFGGFDENYLNEIRSHEATRRGLEGKLYDATAHYRRLLRIQREYIENIEQHGDVPITHSPRGEHIAEAFQKVDAEIAALERNEAASVARKKRELAEELEQARRVVRQLENKQV